MKRQKGHKHKGRAGGVEFCPGYVDEYGIWNNGFTCPKWGGPNEKYCCGAATKRFCCPEPEPLEPVDYDKHSSSLATAVTSHEPTPSNDGISQCSILGECQESSFMSIPLIAGVSAIVVIVILVIIVLVACFVCRCCPGYKRMKRTRRAASGQTREVQCSHCHATTTTTIGADGSGSDEPTLACGCPIGGAGHHHHHHRDSSIPASDLVLTLFENPNAVWQTGEKPDLRLSYTSSVHSSYNDVLTELGDPHHPEFPLDDPPPYKEVSHHSHSLKHPPPPQAPHPQAPVTDTDSTKSTDDNEMTPLNNTFRLSNPNLLCMTTFRPLHSPVMSPTFYMPSPRDQLEYSKRDSGCIDEDMQQDETSEAGDHDASSIMVPKFNFQSLSLCRSLTGGVGGGGGQESMSPEAFGLSSPPHS